MNTKDIWIISPRRDRVNFLEPPPGVSPQEWLARLKNVFREVFYLLNGSINLLDNLIRNLYKNRGIFDGSGDYPCLRDLLRLLDSIEFKPGTRFYGYRESLVNRFRGLEGELGETYACRRGYDIRRLAEGIRIFEIGGLSDDKCNFYIYEKLLRLSCYYETLPPVPLRTIIITEEAHKLFNEKTARRYDLGEGMLFGSARTSRKRGEGFIYSDQTPSELPGPVCGNIDKLAVMRLVNFRCIRFAANAMCLTPERAETIPVLAKRDFVFQSSDYPQPVLVRMPELSFAFVSDEEVDRHMEMILPELDFTPCDETIELLDSNEARALPGEKSRPAARPNRLWTEIAKLLAEIRWISLTDLAAHLGNLAPWHLRKALSGMEKQDLIELCPISFGTRGNPKTFVVLKAKGAEFIGLKFDDVKLAGKGSTEHVILQNLLAETMKDAGKSVAIEHSANGKAVDIAEMRENGAIAYEIELAPSHPHVAENALRDLEAGFDEVVIVTRNQAGQNEAKDQIYKAIPWEKLQRVKFRLLREFF